MWNEDEFTICANCKHLAQEHHTGNLPVPCKAFNGTNRCKCDFFIDGSKVNNR